MSPETMLSRLSQAEANQPPVVRDLLRESAMVIIEIEDRNRQLREQLDLLLIWVGDHPPQRQHHGHILSRWWQRLQLIYWRLL